MLLRRLAWVLILAGLSRSATAKLTADQLLLVGNKNIPDSVELVTHYAKVRQVPPAQILILDLPRGEDILAQQYESRIATPVREYLQSEQGKAIHCVVLFYGVPLHVGASSSTMGERTEIAMLRRAVAEIDRRSQGIADSCVAVAKKLDIDIKPTSATGTYGSKLRVESAAQALQNWVRQNPKTDEQHQQVLAELVKIQASIASSSKDVLDIAFAGADAPLTSRPSQAPVPESNDAREAIQHPRDSVARDKVRRFTAANGGIFALWQIVQQQIEWIDADQSDAAVDSELTLVREKDFPRGMYRPNVLQLLNADRNTNQIMVCRIDAPTPQIARRIIDDSIAIEKEGLNGVLAIDSRGLPAAANGQPDAYGWYDQVMRDTVRLVSAKTSVKVVADDRAQVFLPNTVGDVALYCGWYSLQNYIPGCKFNRGAVGYHVASLELTTMRDPKTKEWVSNMLRDGICATLGAVSEPYLSSFPKPDDFFPILMTGNWTLAETYWMTCPMASWKIILIGDPLYKPYAARPAMPVEMLPIAMRDAISKIEARDVAGPIMNQRRP